MHSVGSLILKIKSNWAEIIEKHSHELSSGIVKNGLTVVIFHSVV